MRLKKTHDKATENIDLIFSICCDATGVSVQLAKSSTRKREAVTARQIFFYIMRKYTRLSLTQIGSRAGFSFDHATVLWGLRSVEAQIDTNRVFKQTIKEVIQATEEIIYVKGGILSDKEIVSEVLIENTTYLSEDLERLIHEDSRMDGWRKIKAYDLISRMKSNLHVLK